MEFFFRKIFLLKFGLIPEFVGRLPIIATLKELDKKDALDDLLNSYEVENEETEVKHTEDLVGEELDRDYLDALSNDNDDDNLIEEELNRDYDSLEDLEDKKDDDNDLFDLIDSMYSKEDEE